MTQINTLIKPTHSCNLRCKYCFAEKYGYDASLLDIKKLKKYLSLLANNYEYVNVVWHGGEPLMAPMDYYEEIYDYCKKLDTNFMYSIQTNGILLNNNNINFFKKNMTSIGLSFDGLTNDKTRGGTQKLLENVELLQSNGMNPGVVMVVNQNNVNNLIEEYKYFKRLNVGLKMNPMFKDGAAQYNDLYLNPDDYIQNFIQFFKYWVFDNECNINVSTCMDFVNLILNENVGVCTFNSCLKKWLCLDADGHIYPCDRLCMKEYDLGDISSLSSINQIFDNKNFIKLLKKSINRRQKCIDDCKYYKNCYGGCNANAILNEVNKNNVSCYIQIQILSEIRDFIINLKDSNNYSNLNHSLVKILSQRV
jgi:uncharacterized protein